MLVIAGSSPAPWPADGDAGEGRPSPGGRLSSDARYESGRLSMLSTLESWESWES